jgi:acyl-CoA ligase (AMP-forming) (exosortase A-associated)
MPVLLHDLFAKARVERPNKNAIGIKSEWLSYQTLDLQVEQLQQALLALGLMPKSRIAIYLPKSLLTVVTMFAVSKSAAIFIPINPTLKARQVEHILADSTAKVLFINKARLKQLDLCQLDSIEHIIVSDGESDNSHRIKIWTLDDLLSLSTRTIEAQNIIDSDVVSIFYTSGSTGSPKGVVLSHRNMVMGAKSVQEYLPCQSSDVMLATQPLSFDYGFSQISIAFLTGASCYLHDYFFENDFFKIINEQKITTLALVPPLWIKLANANWPDLCGESIRYFCNTGGAMPETTLSVLRAKMPNASPYLMYGLTEAFRSCYLPPDQIDDRPTSFGKAIPNACISVINAQGKECLPNEEGELVHAGALVSLGYWNDINKTKERFKPAPDRLPQLPFSEMAVWSGDIVKKDQDGFLYYVGRKDDQIKTSGYRISPEEIESVLYQMEDILEAVVVGVPHFELGEAIIGVVALKDSSIGEKEILAQCRLTLPNYMIPKVIVKDSLPRNANNKFDRNIWKNEFSQYFIGEKS